MSTYYSQHFQLILNIFVNFQFNIEEITTQMNKYKSLAIYLTRIYCIVQKIQNVHPLYHFSLQTFKSLLESTLMESLLTKAAICNIDARIEEAKNIFIEKIYQILSISLFKGLLVIFSTYFQI